MHFYIAKCYFFTLDTLFVGDNDSFSGPVTGHYRWFNFLILETIVMIRSLKNILL